MTASEASSSSETFKRRQLALRIARLLPRERDEKIAVLLEVQNVVDWLEGRPFEWADRPQLRVV